MGASVSFPITAFVGPNGSGKTLAMVETLVMPAIEAGRPVIANFHVDYDGWVPLTSWRQLSTVKDAVVCLDEISSILPSRQFQSLPPELLRRLNQLRKARVLLGWTAPAWMRCDKALRECTQGVVVCQGFHADRYHRQAAKLYRFPRSGPAKKDDEGHTLMVGGWRPNRMFRWSTYDARQFDDFNEGVINEDQAKPHSVRYYWRPGHDAHRKYSTGEEVMLMDHLDDVGRCVICNGTRAPRKCGCSAEELGKALGLDQEEGHVHAFGGAGKLHAGAAAGGVAAAVEVPCSGHDGDDAARAGGADGPDSLVVVGSRRPIGGAGRGIGPSRPDRP